MQFSEELWGRTDGLIWIYSRMVSFECGSGGLFQNISLTLECKINLIFRWNTLCALYVVYCKKWIMHKNIANDKIKNKSLILFVRMNKSDCTWGLTCRCYTVCFSLCVIMTRYKYFPCSVVIKPHLLAAHQDQFSVDQPRFLLSLSLSVCSSAWLTQVSSTDALAHSTLVHAFC